MFSEPYLDRWTKNLVYFSFSIKCCPAVRHFRSRVVQPNPRGVLDLSRLSVGRLLRPACGRVLKVLLPPIGCLVEEAIGVRQ